MNFELTEEQRALQDSLARLLSDKHGDEQRRALAASEGGYSPEIWAHFANLGVTALVVPEVDGGLGGTIVDLMVVMQELGRSSLASPLLGSCVLPAIALQLDADEITRRQWLAALASGEKQLAWAHDELGGDCGANWVSTRAIWDGTRWMLEGRKLNVLHAGSADQFLVSARTAGSDGDPTGRALFLVPADAPGLALRNYRLIDGTPAGELLMTGVSATPVSSAPGATAWVGIDAALMVGIVAACADMVGAMETAFRLTTDYLNTRQQFGRLIGQNQALRHKLAEMLVGLELARSMTMGAAVCADRPVDREIRADLHRAKIVVGRYARSLCQMAIQLHGGIGMTQEYPVGQYLRRVHVLDQMFGDAEMHAEKLA
ncbi:MAG: acyl-CoA dehydrogenase, partial [Rhodocyclaceae bacterium]|nr:acyl-CoA dehydrogenase [Rhodocyclaceae bacterium]